MPFKTKMYILPSISPTESTATTFWCCCFRSRWASPKKETAMKWTFQCGIRYRCSNPTHVPKASKNRLQFVNWVPTYFRRVSFLLVAAWIFKMVRPSGIATSNKVGFFSWIFSFASMPTSGVWYLLLMLLAFISKGSLKLKATYEKCNCWFPSSNWTQQFGSLKFSINSAAGSWLVCSTLLCLSIVSGWRLWSNIFVFYLYTFQGAILPQGAKWPCIYVYTFCLRFAKVQLLYF